MTAKSAQRTIVELIDGRRNRRKKEELIGGELEQYDQGMRGDIAFVANALQWAWADAFEISTGRRERGVVHRALTEKQRRTRIDEHWRGAEYVPGAKFDIGRGNHRAQHALYVVRNELPTCDRILDSCCVAAIPDDGERHRLPVIVEIPNGTMLELDAGIETIRWRLTFLVNRATRLDDAIAGAVVRALHRANKRVNAMRGLLEDAMRQQDKNNPTAIAPEDVCFVCKLRRRMRDHRRCHTCHTYRKRNGGVERPVDLDAA